MTRLFALLRRAVPAVVLGVVVCAGMARADAQGRPPASGALDGVVTTLNGTVRLPGVKVVVITVDNREFMSLMSEGDGHFHVDRVPEGQYRVVASLDGFTTLSVTTTAVAGKAVDVPIDLAIATLTDTVDVVAPPAVVSSADTLARSDTINDKETDRLAPGGGLGAAMRLLASVIEVPGGMSIKGGRPTQSSVQIGASTLADPAMGLVHLTLPDDAIDSVSVLPNPYAVEYGRFSSGLVLIQTRRAGDQWRLRLNNFDPTLRTKRREDWNVKGIAGFGPRLELGGPILKDRLFLEQTAQYRYSTDDIPSRPEDERQTTHWVSSFSRVDANLTPRHSLIGMVGVFPSVTTFASLGTFVPPDATVDLHERVNHVSLTERALWSDRLISESTVQWRGTRTNLDPQSTAPMQLYPDTTLGNFYNTQARRLSTLQWIETVSGSASGASDGLHLFKAGLDVLVNGYDGMSASRPVLILRPTGTLSRRLDFSGPTQQVVNSTDVAFFAQDRWQFSTRWYLEYGARLDRDGVVDRWNLTPRVGAAVLLDPSGAASLRGGFGLFYERTPSAAGAFTQFETFTDTRFAADGVTPISRMPFTNVTDPNLLTARSRTWDVSYDNRVTPRWSVHAGLLERRDGRELIVDSLLRAGVGQLLLDSAGTSLYRALEVGVHYARSPAADVNVTYAYALAESDLNAFARYFDAMMWPIVTPNQYGPSGTDVPHRLLARGHVMPTPRWLLIGVLDWRTGLPYSVVNDALDFVGPRNVLRLPNRFHVDLGVERRFHLFKLQPWIGMRVYNALDSFNPVDVQANLSSPAFGTFYNSEFRQFRLQLRFER
ncbi:MAG: TonB-dependent receptor [Acidobacteria bacterium]|nr:TonB-dependent receptor [Acidobacteriota bacterium]